MQEGDYTYQLTVTDTAGQQATAQVTVIVQPGKLLPRILPALGPQAGVLGCRPEKWKAGSRPSEPESHPTRLSPFALQDF